MMGLQTFTFGAQSPVRTLLKGEEPWFVAADVCAALTIGNPTEAVRNLDDDEKGLSTTETPSGPQEMVIISESGLYTLILRSRKPQARAFRRWVTHEVLPALRRTGHYKAPAAGSISGASVLRYEDQPVRLFQSLGQPWVSAKDFCLACGYSWHKGGALVAHVPSTLRGLAQLEGLEGDSRQHVVVLSLAGVKAFASRARYAEAQDFYAWMRALPVSGLPETRVDPTEKRTPRLRSKLAAPALAMKQPVFVPPAKERARFGEEALQAHQHRADMRDLRYAYEAHMPQLLADLMHLAEEQGISFDAMMTRARQHFTLERATH